MTQSRTFRGTQGPWTPRAQGDANDWCVLDDRKRWVISFRQNGEIYTPEQRANMQLIAAAPAMFDALKLIEECGQPQCEACVARVRLALDLATKIQ